jgi:hypothetical protein
MTFDCAQITGCWLRVLLPFRLELAHDESLSANHIQEAFKSQQADGEAWQFARFGESKVAHSAHMRDYCEHVNRYLYDGIGLTGCYYLRHAVSAGNPFVGPIQVANQSRESVDGSAEWNRPKYRGWQQILLGKWKSNVQRLQQDAAIRSEAFPDSFATEIWLSKLGVGVLSVPFHFVPESGDSLDFAKLLDLVHSLLTAQRFVWIGDLQSQKPVLDVHESISQILMPLRQLGSVSCESRAMVHATLELSHATENFANDDFLQRVQQKLCHVAQLHPSSHCGIAGPVEGVVFNAEHCAVVDIEGFAHAVMHGQAGHTKYQADYATARGRRSQLEYFPAALLAILQKCVITELLARASTALSQLGDDTLKTLSQVRRLALAFSVEGEFIQVAKRSTIQVYHERAQEQLEVNQGLERIQNCLEGFAQMEAQAQNVIHQEEVKLAAAEAHRSERKMQLLECFLVSVYSVAVAHYLASAFGLPHNLFLGLSMVVLQIVTIASVSIVVFNRPRSHASLTNQDQSALHSYDRFLIPLLLVFIIVFIAVNIFYNPK